jgi:MGT family glycosyltransferase
VGKYFLLAAWGGPGNYGPLLTAGRRLRRCGHRVRTMGDPDLRGEAIAAGFEFAVWQRPRRYTELETGTPDAEQSIIQFLCDHVMVGPAAAYAADLLDELQRDRADGLLITDFLFGAAMAAEAAGLPCAMLSPHISLRPLPGVPPAGSGLKPPRTPMEHAEVAAANERLAATFDEFLPTLNAARAELGLHPLDHVFDQYDLVERVLMAMSPTFDFRADRLPDNMRYVGPLLDEPGWSLPWTTPWSRPRERPRALVSLSTTFQNQAALLQRMIDALGSLELDAVVTTGPAMADAGLRAPPNVVLVDSAPHGAVMREVSLVITHGGHGTVTRALAHGLPLLVVPMGRDQDDNALRVTARGAGLALPTTASGPEIAAAVNRLIVEPRFAAAARRLSAAIAADLSSPALVDELEAMTACIPAARRAARG